MITIVDYGLGNLGSIVNMYKRLGIEARISADLQEIRSATKLLLPGVGAFDAAMERIERGGFREVLHQKALVERVPTLGICLGMQLLTEGSEEGTRPGLGWLRARTKKFVFSPGSPLKIPHMGWNTVEVRRQSPLTAGLPEESRFYFVHSYHVQAENRDDVITQTSYGIAFVSIIGRDNIFGAQFHPEKSHRFGMILLSNFASL